ncbi:hypothetical protein MXD60_11890 [Frankia sp. AgB32]|nr:hypothetical protein [Frankia sp. AgB32]MCK9895289.1 hypothetical protein [Frankia sp. AgB32]
MASDLAGTRVAFLVAPDGAGQVELTEPWAAVRDAGGEPVPVSTRPGQVQAFHSRRFTTSTAATTST